MTGNTIRRRNGRRTAADRASRLKEYVLQDWDAKRGNNKGQLVLAAFRAAQVVQGDPGRSPGPAAKGVLAAYRLLVEFGMGIELPPRTRVGPRLRLYHGVGLVVNEHTVIGADVSLRHGTTIGHQHEGGPSPVIEDGVDVGASAVILGPVTVGEGASVGAGAVVVKDVPTGAVVVGNPARQVR